MLVRWLFSNQPLLDLRYRFAELERAFQRRCAHAELVQIDMLALAGLMQQAPLSAAIVLNEHDVEHRLLRSRIELEAGWSRRWLQRLQLLRLRAFEARACQDADRVLACSRVDARQLKALAPDAHTSLVPNGVDTAAFLPNHDTETVPESLVFVGQMSWFPNRDGIEHFISDILPHLDHRRDLHLDVVGRLDHAVAAAPDERIRFHGFVEDLPAFVQRRAVFIVPLRMGSGTRLKVLEAMAMGMAIVSTRKGAEGIGLVDGRNVLLADTPADFAEAVERLLDDPGLRERLGRAAREAAVSGFSWDAVAKRLQHVYRELLAGRRQAADAAAPIGEEAVQSETPIGMRKEIGHDTL
jgi:glycosyltransferase involved in cell wall biosynthesis